MKTSLFDYDLPRDLIAAQPAETRTASRLLVMDRHNETLEHRRFSDLPQYLVTGDLLVVNDSRVIRARLHGRRAATGGAAEFLLLERADTGAGAPASCPAATADTWVAMCRPARRLRTGETVVFGPESAPVTATVVRELGDGRREVAFDVPDILPHLDRLGEVPLPPYIVQRRRELRDEGMEPATTDDIDRYQTVYARDPGSVAAPTAGLHFSDNLLHQIRAAGVGLASVTLHVGPGTFKPVEADDTDAHVMHTERYRLSEECVTRIAETRAAGRRVIAVGTTVVRSLESAAASGEGPLAPGAYHTNLMITPGYRFRVIDAMITNFHLPRSTLLMLVSAFAGREAVLAAYAEAIRERYRFYSYGDAMLVV